MNDLVERLSRENFEVEATRPEKTAAALKECIDRNYVHIMFKKTQTELGIKLDKKNCDFSGCDFEKGVGDIHLEGGVTLNYETVKVVVDISLQTLEGKGKLIPVGQDEYDSFMLN